MNLVIQEKIKPNKPKEYVTTLSCCINPQDMGTEHVNLEVDVFDNGDNNDFLFTNIHFTINSGVSTVKLTLSTGDGLFDVCSKLKTELEIIESLLQNKKNCQTLNLLEPMKKD